MKELVDNSVDACTAAAEIMSSPTTTSGRANNTTLKRVRVMLETLDRNDEDSALRVTVSDNGCGMEDIEACVSAFSSNKQVSQSSPVASSQMNSNSNNNCPEQTETTGRYGIGLTLCLLHAQSLVQNSYAVVTSATKDSDIWTKAKYVVDENEDVVHCIEKSSVMKTRPGDCGTSVCMLVPVSEVPSCIICFM